MPDIIHETTIASSAAALYRALTTVDGLTGFWTDQVDGGTPASVGAITEFGFGPKKETVFGMRIEALVEPRLVVWNCQRGPDEWKGTKVRWELRAVDGAGPASTKVRFEHRGWMRENGDLGSCSFTWAEILMRLRDLVVSGERSPRFARGST